MAKEKKKPATACATAAADARLASEGDSRDTQTANAAPAQAAQGATITFLRESSMANLIEEAFAPKQPQAASVSGLHDLARAVIKAREAADKAKCRAQELAHTAEQLEVSLMDRIEAEGLKSFKALGRNFVPATKRYFTLPKEPEKRHAALVWLRRIGAAGMIKEDINHNTLTGLCRERLENGKPISELIQSNELKYLSIRKD